jgi:hypothetical protein
LQSNEILKRIEGVESKFTRNVLQVVVSNEDLKESKKWVFSHFVDKLKFKSTAIDQKIINDLKDDHDQTKLYTWTLSIQTACVKLLGTCDRSVCPLFDLVAYLSIIYVSENVELETDTHRSDFVEWADELFKRTENQILLDSIFSENKDAYQILTATIEARFKFIKDCALLMFLLLSSLLCFHLNVVLSLDSSSS